MTFSPNKSFYIIQQESTGRGLFSLLSAVICNLHYATLNNLEPAVDFLNYTCVYNEQTSINGTMNAFEYYFKPVSSYSLEYIYSSGNYLLSDSTYPSGYDFTIANIPGMLDIYDQFIFLNTATQLKLDEFLQLHSFDSDVLGVHFRGKEMRTARGHWYPPTKKQMLTAIDMSLSDYNYKRIFVSSEDISLIEFLSSHYPGLVFYNTNYYRSLHGNSYNESPRPLHFYNLGLEVLIDMFALSMCRSLISCSSNVAWFARFINNNRYRSHIFINNGPNRNFWPLSSVAWYIKNKLPVFIKGFKCDASVMQEQIFT